MSGEEEEESVFSTRGRVFVTTKREDGTPYWREHGKGPIKINVHKETKRSRIGEYLLSLSFLPVSYEQLADREAVMRTDGTFQLKMNMRIFPEMGLKKLNDIVSTTGDRKENWSLAVREFARCIAVYRRSPIKQNLDVFQ